MALSFALLLLLWLAAPAYVLWCALRLTLNTRKARALGVPIVRIPFDLDNYVWVAVQPLAWKALACLMPEVPWSAYPDFVRFSNHNWHFLEKSSPAARFGSVWALVTPGGIHLNVADAEAIHDICARWRDFVRPVEMFRMLSVFGPSVFTVDMEDWPRHRKAISAPFNERTMRVAWEESLRQTQALVDRWSCNNKNEIHGIGEELHSFTLHVLANSIFGNLFSMQERSSTPVLAKQSEKGVTAPAAGSSRDAFFTVHRHIIWLMLVPYRLLMKPWMPPRLSCIGRAAATLNAFMTEMVAKEATALDRGDTGSGGLFTQLVQALEPLPPLSSEPLSVGRGPMAKARGLSADEILGNIFVINFAGYDTSSLALSFTLFLLAANPKWQTWLHEEIHDVTRGHCPVATAVGKKDVDDDYGWDYALFTRLLRCRAVIYETLRLYPPITGLPKVVAQAQTRGEMQPLRAGGDVLALPPGLRVYPMILGVQTDPRYWGADAHEWRPSRWILGSGEGNNAQEGSETQDRHVGDEFLVPPIGTFIPWAEGAQGCVGKKFAAVEMVAMVARLFCTHRVRVIPEAQESEEQACRRAQECVDDNNYNLLLRMNHPERVRLGFVPVQLGEE